jgi:hypothetical protein
LLLLLPPLRYVAAVVVYVAVCGYVVVCCFFFFFGWLDDDVCRLLLVVWVGGLIISSFTGKVGKVVWVEKSQTESTNQLTPPPQLNQPPLLVAITTTH